MFKGVNTILFTTNLTRNCIPAFDVAVLLALRFQAKIVLLHVLEKIPDYVGGRLEGLLGEEQWKQMMLNYENEARQTLIGKRSSSKLIRKVLEHFCTEAGIDDESCGYHAREVVIIEGEVVESIIETSKKYDCDMIIMGGHEGLISKKTVGTTIKSVLKRSAVPVMVVPIDPEVELDAPNISGWRE